MRLAWLTVMNWCSTSRSCQKRVQQSPGSWSLKRRTSARLNRLFASFTPDDGQEYSNERVAAAIRSKGEVTISQSYIWQLRKGKKFDDLLISRSH